MQRQVAALFVRADSVYKALPAVDAWDAGRDARSWPGGCPVVAHLPALPVRDGAPTHCVRPTKSYPRLPSITHAQREHTPQDLAVWLVEVARCCSPVYA
jgi:hypothetical protein